MKIILILSLIVFSPYLRAKSPKMSIIKTGVAQTLEGLVYAEGSIFKKYEVVHSGFLIMYKGRNILFDTGLGNKIDDQYSEDMPVWAKPLFSYEKHSSIKTQLGDKFKINQILLSHAHWDHASGLSDFKGSQVLMSREEFEEIQNPVLNRTFPSQFKDISIDSFDWQTGNYFGFKQFYDLFGDGKVVAVPLEGHSHGSIGLFVLTESRRFFLVGDAIWNSNQLKNVSHKFYISSLLVDGNRDKVLNSIHKIKKIKDRGFTILATHDYSAQEREGFYPIFH